MTYLSQRTSSSGNQIVWHPGSDIMKKYLFILLLFTHPLMANPSFTIGSNHYLTTFAYPHDILKWPEQGVFLLYNPQTLPWQGDVTNISNRPSESYVNNYQQVEFAPPYGYQGDPNDVRSWMRVSGYAHKSHVTLGGLYYLRFGKVLFELGKTSLNMNLYAEGQGRATEDVDGNSVYHMVPFNAQTLADKNDYNLKLIFANCGYVAFNKDGQAYKCPHLTWGWATKGCNQIFGYSHINTDAFFQNSYSVFQGHQLDVQMSYEHNGNYKTGIRYRKNREDGENYRWQYDEGSEILGNYYVDQKWRDRKIGDMIRAYSKVRFWRIRNLDAGFLFFVQRGTYSNMPVNKISGSKSSSRKKEKEFILETNPYFNYKFKGGYLDFGILLELSKTSITNASDRWNPVSGADQANVLKSSSPYSGWSPSWESFSRGSVWFFATGFESYSSIAVHKRLSLLARLTYLRKFSSITKQYGSSELPDGAKSYVFQQTHQRNNSKNENWITGSLGISYGRGPVQLFVTLQFPLAYLVKQKTKLSGPDEKLFEHEKRNMWQVQQPTTMRILMVYALGR
jgi:hypothetical protein